MPDQSIPRDANRALGFLLSDVARMMRAAFDRRVRRLGLTRAQWQVLSLLYHRPGISQTELAEALEVERATAGRMIDRMERKGWLLRVADPLDRRINRLELTAEAHGIEAEMHRAATELLEEALARLDPEERDALAEMLGRMKAELQAMAPRAAAGTEARLAAMGTP
jgi:MarR family transcriptional regulator, transcriptional regulator for hemolysin